MGDADFKKSALKSFAQKKIDALVNEYIRNFRSHMRPKVREKRYAEKEKAFEETERKLSDRLTKSREYRIMLRDYQKSFRNKRQPWKQGKPPEELARKMAALEAVLDM